MSQVVYESVRNQTCNEFKEIKSGKNCYLLLRIGNEFYGIESRKVDEIIGKEQIVSIPFMPEYIIGVINLENNIIPIMDLRKKFNFKKLETPSTYSQIAIIDIDGFRVGIIIDDITEYHEQEHENFYITSTNETGKRNISGFVKIGDQMGILLDVEKIVLQEKTELEVLKNSILWSFK